MKMKVSFYLLSQEEEMPYLSGSSSTGAITTSSMIAPTLTGAADASINSPFSDDLEELYKRKVCQKKTSAYLSSITLKLDEKSTVYQLENATTPDYLLDLKIRSEQGDTGERGLSEYVEGCDREDEVLWQSIGGRPTVASSEESDVTVRTTSSRQRKRTKRAGSHNSKKEAPERQQERLEKFIMSIGKVPLNDFVTKK